MNSKIRFTRFAVVLVLVLSAIGLASSTALAQKPVKSEYTWTPPTGVMEGICSFPIAVDSTVNVTEIDYSDQSGALIRMDWHMVEQDTFHMVIGYQEDGTTPIFGAKQLVSVPFTFNLLVLVDSQGNFTHAYADGVTEKIWLPDGSLFISAGRVDFAAHGFPAFILSPDHGRTGNLAGFCAALQ
jgi:hypothetical protein